MGLLASAYGSDEFLEYYQGVQLGESGLLGSERVGIQVGDGDRYWGDVTVPLQGGESVSATSLTLFDGQTMLSADAEPHRLAGAVTVESISELVATVVASQMSEFPSELGEAIDSTLEDSADVSCNDGKPCLSITFELSD